MAETVLSFVLNKLSTILRDEGRLLGGLRQDVQHIRDELGHMRAFLKVAEAKEEDDPRLQEWIKQVREAAYDAEDLLDEFVFHFACQRSKGFYGCIRRIFSPIKNFQARHHVASEIQSIKSRIKNISEGHRRYQSEYGITAQGSGSLAAVDNNAWRYSRDDALLVEEARLVGINKSKRQLISQLIEGDSQFKVVSVVGMGGLGKTTLVKKVYEDADVRRHFSIRAWVTVSQTCDFQELLKSLIHQLHVEDKKSIPQLIERMTTLELKEFIKDFLQQGRYAIVFDDVWDMEFWNVIKFALPENKHGSRIMLTTRVVDVATASCIECQGYVYKLEPLSFADSWTLFCNKAFRNSYCPGHLENVARGIVGKCEGLPLAIVAIGSLLALRDVGRIDDWQSIQCSLGDELESTGKLDKVKKILCLSYNDLPFNLKTCLLYISIFPEDYEIPCPKLIQLWIAERFVEWREGRTIEDVAFDYLTELANRSLIQVTAMNYEGIPLQCRIHDLLREVILHKSREQNMITIATGQHTRWPEKVQRLVINNFLDDTQERYCFNHLRSLISFGSMESLSKNLLFELLSSKLLKVLDLRNAQLQKIPNEIFNLFHLNYLCLRGTGIKTVPKSIGKLQNLEYLDLSGTTVRELPMEILKLKKLRHIWVCHTFRSANEYFKDYGFKAPSKMGELLALHTLFYIEATAKSDEPRAIVKEIGKLTQLRKLGITNLRREDGKQLCSSLEKLTNLRQLNIFSTNKDEVIDLNYFISSSPLQFLRMLFLGGRLEKMPQWISHLQGLARVDLWGSGLSENPLESLQHFPNLVIVNLNNEAYIGEGFYFKSGGFSKLKELNLRKFEGLRWMTVEEGAMPHLQQLLLQELPLLEELPLGIQHLSQVQKLRLFFMSSQLIEKLENQGEHDGQIAHIPEVIISYWSDGKVRKRQLWGKKEP